jgi:hypothetical protein
MRSLVRGNSRWSPNLLIFGAIDKNKILFGLVADDDIVYEYKHRAVRVRDHTKITNNKRGSTRSGLLI